MTDEPFEIVRDPQIAELLGRFAGSTLDLAAELTKRLPADQVRAISQAFDAGGQMTATACFGAVPTVRLAVVDVDGDEVVEIATITQPAPAPPGVASN